MVKNRNEIENSFFLVYKTRW